LIENVHVADSGVQSPRKSRCGNLARLLPVTVHKNNQGSPTYLPAQSSTIAVRTSAPCGLLRTALRTIPFGKAKVVKPGQNLTLISYGALVQKALLAATGVSIEIIDLRTLAPYDWEAIRASVEKTSRVMVVHEDCVSWGYGAEIAARIGDELFEHLDAPVRRVGALDTWVGYHPQLEAAILPQTDTLMAEMGRLLGY
jgi:pyruvate/2-oxoglutarate/acetoin dehydrogenase E1 component